MTMPNIRDHLTRCGVWVDGFIMIVYYKLMNSEELYTLLSKGRISLSTDTRTLREGDVYLALKGEQFDGHAFVEDALTKGARMAIVDQNLSLHDERIICVTDTKKTLRELAMIHRQQFSIPIIAIGGSNGKTTTKELVTAVLGTTYNVHSTKGNFNNDIGVPLTILAMTGESEIAVIEIGANHPGEHAVLMEIVAPTHVLVTNNGADHLEGFGTLEGVRLANKEIYDWAKTHHIHAFVDKTIADLVEDSEGIERTLYPTTQYNSVKGLTASLNYDGVLYESQLFGSFNEINIIAAITIGTFFKASTESIREAVKNYTPTLKRSQIINHDNYTLVLDCYNANPTSMELSLKDFLSISSAGNRILVIGDMFELGASEQAAHHDMLDVIKNTTDAADTVLCVGPRFSQFKEEYPFNFFPTTDEARLFFTALPISGKYIFVKGSRGIHVEDVVM